MRNDFGIIKVEKPPRIQSLEAVRAMAFLAIFLYHAVKSFPGKGIIYKVLSIAPGAWGVSVFFVLSGFLMTYSYWNRQIEHGIKEAYFFSIRKIKRLYPLHLVMLLVGAIRLYIHRETLIGIGWRLLLTIPLIQTWFPVGYMSVNSVAWYLSVCLFLYFMFPFLLPWIKESGLKQSCIRILLIYLSQFLIGLLVYRFTSLEVIWVTYCHPLYRLGDFAIGGLLASIFIGQKDIEPEEKHSSLYSLLEIIILFINVAACYYYAVSPKELSFFTYTCLYIPTSCLLVYVFAMNRGFFSKILTNKIVFFIADLSPYAFLIHRLVIYYFQDYILYVLKPEKIHICFAVFAPFVITMTLSYLWMKMYKFYKKSKQKKEAIVL